MGGSCVFPLSPASSLLEPPCPSAGPSPPLTAKPLAGPSAADLKTATQLEGAIYEVLMRVRFGQPLAAADAPKDVLKKKVAPKKDNHPAGHAYTGLVLKSNPNKVVIQRSGGFAGLTASSQPIDVTRLPK